MADREKSKSLMHEISILENTESEYSFLVRFNTGSLHIFISHPDIKLLKK